MLEVEIKEGVFLQVGSSWDSGTHKGFYAQVYYKDNYSGQPLSDNLTKEEIRSVEATILCTVANLLENKTNEK